MPLSEDQLQTISDTMAFLVDPTAKGHIILGKPGVGKTYVVRQLLLHLETHKEKLKHLVGNNGKLNVIVTATSNKAAKVLRKALGDIVNVTTIFSQLKLRPVPNFKTGKEDLKQTKGQTKVRINNALCIIDEAYTISAELGAFISDANNNAKFLFIGDKAQTKPIGENDYCWVEEQGFSKSELTTNHRQKLTNNKKSQLSLLIDGFRKAVILTDVAEEKERTEYFKREGKELKWLTGKYVTPDMFPIIIPDNITVFQQWEEFESTVNTLFTGADYKVDVVKLIAYKNKTVQSYNDYIHTLITGSPILILGDSIVTNKPILLMEGRTIPVETILTITAERVATGMGVRGRWLVLDEDIEVFLADDAQEVNLLITQHAECKNWPMYFKCKEFFSDLRAVYSSTVHKAQGSTYKVSLIDLEDIGECRSANDVARLLNVAASRATDYVVFYGQLPPKYAGVAY